MPTALRAPVRRPSLEELTALAIDLIGESVDALRMTLIRARDTGRVLIKLRARVKSDKLNWREWLEVELPISYDCAIRYMRVARKWATIEPELNRPGGLTLKAALELIADGKRRTPPRSRPLEDIEAKIETQMLLVWLNRQPEAVRKLLFEQTEHEPMRVIGIIKQYLASREAL